MWYNEYKMDDINVLNDIISKNENCIVFCESLGTKYDEEYKPFVKIKIHVCNKLVIRFFYNDLYYRYKSMFSFIVYNENYFSTLKKISETHKIILLYNMYDSSIILPVNNNIYHQENLNILITSQRYCYDYYMYDHLLSFLKVGTQLLPMHITNIIIQRWYIDNNKKKSLKLLHEYDIPLSFDNILQSIQNRCELLYVHKYGYDMNSIPFLCKYIEHDFYPSSYNIDFPQYFVHIYEKLRHVNKMVRLVNVIKDVVKKNEPIYIVGIYGDGQSMEYIENLLLFTKDVNNSNVNRIYQESCEIYCGSKSLCKKNRKKSRYEFLNENRNILDLLKIANNGTIFTDNYILYQILKNDIDICLINVGSLSCIYCDREYCGRVCITNSKKIDIYTL